LNVFDKQICRFIAGGIHAPLLRTLILLSARLCAIHGLALQAQSIHVLGSVGGILGRAGAQYIQGWACETKNPHPLKVQIYTDGGRGVGQLYRTYVANASPGDREISNARASAGCSASHRLSLASAVFQSDFTMAASAFGHLGRYGCGSGLLGLLGGT